MTKHKDIWWQLAKAQGKVFRSPARFRILVAGRRFGKTHLALVELLYTAWNNPGYTVWYVAPTYRQAKRIAWDRLKSLINGHLGAVVLETDLTIRFGNGSVISLRGADNYDSLRGNGLDFVILDEFAGMKSETWTEVIRPALADRQGRALFIGTPQGHDHLYDRFQLAQSDPHWAAFQFQTLEGGIVTAEELESAASELDPRLYRQEFEASFESTGVGLAYTAFSREANVVRCDFRPTARLIWSLDFNVHPMCSVVAQRLEESISKVTYERENVGMVEVLDEFVLEDSNTTQACERFWQRAHPWRSQISGPLHVEIHGDASGHQRRTCGSATDWTLIRDFFNERSSKLVAHIKAAQANPGVRNRVNLVNSRLLNANGERRLFIDPRCKQLIADLERVTWRLDHAGQPISELDKSDRRRTHLSDALGYYLTAAFPIYGKVGAENKRIF